MRFALDISQISRDNAGINQYAREVVRRLVEHSEHEFILVAKQPEEFALELKDKSQLLVLPVQPKWKGGWYKVLATQLKREKIDAFLALPLSPMALFFDRTVSFIYDLAPLTSNQYSSRFQKIRYALLIRLNLWRARGIITISKATLTALNKLFPTKKDIHVPIAYPGLSDRFNQNVSLEEVEKFKRQYGIGEKFVLSVGTVQPRKNYLTSIQAFFEFSLNNNLEWQYLIAGKLGWDYQLVLDYIAQNHLEEKVKILTDLTDYEVVVALNAANVFLQLSIEEGFGMPLVEASSMALPIVASDIEVFKEIDSPNTIYVDPTKPSLAARALEQACSTRTSPATKQFLKRFNWDNTTEIVLKALISAAQ